LAGIQARQSDLQQQLSTKVLDQAQDIASLQSQLRKVGEAFASKITALEADVSTGMATMVEVKSHLDRQEHRLTELFRLLQEEITTRQALTDARDGNEISGAVEKRLIPSGELHQQVEEPE
jgi:hypothetical protein